MTCTKFHSNYIVTFNIAENLLFNGNIMNGRAPEGVCALRDAGLYQFVVDCPVIVDRSEVDGIICSIPDCCSQCL